MVIPSKLKKIQIDSVYFAVATLLVLIIVGSQWSWQEFKGLDEDAAMIPRYAQNLAEGFGVSWNQGGEPVGGATDFLCVLIGALLIKWGLSAETAMRLIATLSHAISVCLVFFVGRKMVGASTWLSFLSAAYLALGPALIYQNVGFLTAFFALCICLCFLLGERMFLSKNLPRDGFLFAIGAFVCGLARPEGFALALMILGGILLRDFRQAGPILRSVIPTFGLLAFVYLAWRHSYFGYVLPLAASRKGGWYPQSLMASYIWTLKFSYPFLMPILLSFLWAGSHRRVGLSILVPVVGFATLWFAISNAQDFYGRFQYATLPMLAISWQTGLGGALQGRSTDWSTNKDRLIRLGILGLFFAATFFQVSKVNEIMDADFFRGTREIGKALSAFKGYTVAISESGNIPFYSGWNTLDTWGINDSRIAREGRISTEYLQEKMPHLIMFNRNDPGWSDLEGALEEQWLAMTNILECFAIQNGYILAARFTNQNYLQGKFRLDDFYFVRPDFRDTQNIVELIRAVKYRMVRRILVDTHENYPAEEVKNKCSMPKSL